MNEMLPQLDTGIVHLGGEEVPFEHLPLPELLKNRIQEEVPEGMTVRFLTEPLNERFLVTRKDGELTAKKLVTFHPREDGTEARFEIRQESDGSQRIIDLLPVILDLSAQMSRKVYVIDEIDRSLHTLLTRRLLEAYLATCSTQTRTQLLFTTHDVLLMDQELLRRDEMWVAERDAAGASSLFSFSEYKDVRYDKDIRKSYLQGRLGGIPRILLGGAMSNSCRVRESEGED
jgi:AAA15 family ATPase/GTPase